MKLFVSPDGRCQAIYDELLDLRELGLMNISRASHVEPTSDGHWTADLSPVRGPILGPFPTRSQAVQAELAWLHEWLANIHGEIRK